MSIARQLCEQKICHLTIRDDVKLVELVRERGTVSPEVVGSIPAKHPKTENSNLHGFEIHRPPSKSTKLLFQVIKSNQHYLFQNHSLNSTFQELYLTPFIVHEILGFELLSWEKLFCHQDISEILCFVQGFRRRLGPWSLAPPVRGWLYSFIVKSVGTAETIYGSECNTRYFLK